MEHASIHAPLRGQVTGVVSIIKTVVHFFPLHASLSQCCDFNIWICHSLFSILHSSHFYCCDFNQRTCYSVCTNCQAAYVMKKKNQYLKIAHAVTWRFSDTQSIHTMAASLIFSFHKTLIYFSDFYFFFFSRKQDLTLHANCLLRLAWNVKSGWHFMQILRGDNLHELSNSIFLEKIRQKNSKCRQLKFNSAC